VSLQARPSVLPLEDGDLLSKSQDLEGQIGARTKQGMQSSKVFFLRGSSAPVRSEAYETAISGPIEDHLCRAVCLFSAGINRQIRAA
jgi:hypothetical protein